MLPVQPDKSISDDTRMKYLEQLQYLKRLLQDEVLTHEEFMEQKEIVLEALRKLWQDHAGIIQNSISIIEQNNVL